MLSLKKSYRGIYKLVLLFLLIFLVFFTLSLTSSFIVYILSFFVLGMVYYHLVMVVHELSHYSFVPSRKLNKVLGHIISPLFGLNFVTYRNVHLQHHASKTIENDPESYIYLPVLQQPTPIKKLFVFFFHAFTEFFTKVRLKSFSSQKNIFVNYSVPLAQIFLLTLFILLGTSYYFFFWLLPLFTITLFLNRLSVLIEHGYSFHNLNHNPQTTINVQCNLLERLIFAPCNFHYHQEHHDHPYVPFYQLPELYSQRNTKKKLNILLTFLCLEHYS